MDPLFAEAPLASPPVPFLKLSVPSWAVISRLLWHIGFAPGIENAAATKKAGAKGGRYSESPGPERSAAWRWWRMAISTS